jgi:hypothetical protein
MFRRVLVATDFSRFADRTLECIGEIPGMEEILLIHVLNKSQGSQSTSVFTISRAGAEEPAENLLAEKGRYLEEMTGVTVNTALIDMSGTDIPGAIIRMQMPKIFL